MRCIALISANTGVAEEILLAELNGKPLIYHTYSAIAQTGLFQDVMLVTASQNLKQAVESNGGKAIKLSKEHNTATDSIAEAANDIDADIFVHIPANMPFASKSCLQKLLNVFEGQYGKTMLVASIVQKFRETAELPDANVIKVALDLRQNAMFFSRFPIPYLQNTQFQINYYKHVPVFAYRKIGLINFSMLPRSPLETAEQIECLRFLENGVQMRMIISQYPDLLVKTSDDLKKAAEQVDKTVSE